MTASSTSRSGGGAVEIGSQSVNCLREACTVSDRIVLVPETPNLEAGSAKGGRVRVFGIGRGSPYVG